jgi:hypothetical protein
MPQHVDPLDKHCRRQRIYGKYFIIWHNLNAETKSLENIGCEQAPIADCAKQEIIEKQWKHCWLHPGHKKLQLFVSSTNGLADNRSQPNEK